MIYFIFATLIAVTIISLVMLYLERRVVQKLNDTISRQRTEIAQLQSRVYELTGMLQRAQRLINDI